MKATLLTYLRQRCRSRTHLRDCLDIMRAALASPGGHVHIGPAGASVAYVSRHGGVASLSGYGLDHVTVALPLLALGLPAIDTRPAEARPDFIVAALRCPLCAVDGRPDPKPPSGWYPLSFAPLDDVISHWRCHGAAILNWPHATV